MDERRLNRHTGAASAGPSAFRDFAVRHALKVQLQIVDAEHAGDEGPEARKREAEQNDHKD
ncbi:hypothetical protein AB7008_40900 [Bradyrhizobium sp. 521_C7_N1_3]|nr:MULTISPECIES: hypothetical protein [Bradyrhizobium]WLB55915.1 hypothetical protein QIH94_07985 [Bradyrhizobium japonicum]WLB62192.1 hypothetical protein QIH96_37825 [Bradyrhizobium japonicum]GEC54686.1 hypothetical protein BEL01nite_37290 [Bradyrhizobium elkanii]